MAHQVPPLPYDFGALEPHIDAQTMEIHHDKHHGAYVTNLNAALEGTEWMDRPIESVLASLDVIPEEKRTAVRNNGGGHWNHTFFWQIMGPNGGGEPSGDLAQAIESTFGGVDALKAQVNDAGVKRFGSGWTWLVRDSSGSLSVTSTPNQDSPVMEGQTPIRLRGSLAPDDVAGAGGVARAGLALTEHDAEPRARPDTRVSCRARDD